MSEASGHQFGDVASAVARITAADGCPATEHGVLRETRRPVRTLALALDHLDGTAAWVAAAGADALFVHRPWALELDRWPDVGVLFSHAPFDACLTTGPNPALATALGLRDVRTFGVRDGRPLAMIGEVDAAPAAAVVARIVAEFSGSEDDRRGDARPVRRMVVASAMTDALVREAAAFGADLYVTGQLRAPGLGAASEAGLHVLAVGHRRSERWGLAALARALSRELPGLACVLPDEAPAGTPDAAPAGR